ncbi:MAG: acetolactate synthase large subunit [Myxococcota bacterium]|jgi:acetolactate synthase-1/2/3 large subunit|nr:acetolactate synthase large subunit [Myxococcota bacterium]
MSKPLDTGAVRALRTAADLGVELCLANPGTTELAFVEALDAVPEIRSVLGLFEGVCTGAADGYGRMAGKPALSLLHLGPGFANGIANLHNARRARSPIVNLIGDQASWHLQHDAPLTSDIGSLASPVSHWMRTSGSPRHLDRDLRDAIDAANGPPAGVSTLIVPADHQFRSANEGNAVGLSVPFDAPASRALDVDRVAERVRAGENIALLLGGNALHHDGVRAAGRIAQRFGAKCIAETFPARWERGTGLPVVDRLPYFPEQAQEALAKFDLVITAGARTPVAFFGYEGIESVLVEDERIACLAEPFEDAAAALIVLADALGARTGDTPDAPPPAAPDLSAALDPMTIGTVVAALLPENAIVMEEGATSSLPFYLLSNGAAPHTVMTLTGGAIGQGMPCATGAALACPDRKVVNLQADGSGMYTLQSLWTQAREGLDVTTLVCSNRAYRILQVEFGRTGNIEPGPKARRLTNLDEPELDWVALARGMGVPGVRIETTEAFFRELPRAIAEPGPQLLELMI